MLIRSISKLVAVAAMLITVATQVAAQDIKSATFSSPQASMGVPIELSIAFQSPGSSPWCGLLIEWGDGEKLNFRIGDENSKTSPIKLTHKYAMAGTFFVSVKGNTMIRGLKSAQACGGVLPPLSITVVDTVALQQAEMKRQSAEREKAAQEEAERAKKELEAKELEMKRQAAEREKLAQEELDRAKKALEAKELEMKRKELEMKEEMLKREEEARRKSQQQRTAAPTATPTPAPTPAPASTGTKPAVKPASGF